MVNNLPEKALKLFAEYEIKRTPAENVKNASSSCVGEFTEKEETLLQEVVAAYNKCSTDSKSKAFQEYVMCTLLRKDSTSAGNCVECGKCEQHCPQKIEIRKELKNAKKELEGPIFKIAKKVIPLFVKY